MSNFDNVDKVLNSFYHLFPYGENYSDLVYDFDFEKKERDYILNFLIKHGLLEDFGSSGKKKISDKGIEVVEKHGGIEYFMNKLESDEKNKFKINKTKNTKLLNDARLSRWKVWTFWPVFLIGLFGGLYSIASIILILSGTSIEQIIQDKQEHIKTLPTQIEPAYNDPKSKSILKPEQDDIESTVELNNK
jgi:hypothetical protein